MHFIATYEPELQVQPEHWVIALRGKHVLTDPVDAQVIHPSFKVSAALLAPSMVLHIGQWHGNACFVMVFDADSTQNAAAWEEISLRSLLTDVDECLFALLGRALQLSHWVEHHRYCGRCGAPTQFHPVERMLLCSHCEAQFYPHIAPCVIGIVTRGNQCLLARNVRFRDHYFSVLAGFIEPGETAEQALAREVSEEVGIQIRDIQYVTSQPWPFPSQLMLGFLAHYASGDIVVDNVEIAEAHWFRVDQLPQVPPPETIAGRLIQLFINQVAGEPN